MSKATEKEMDKLIANLDNRAKPPLSMGLWSDKMIILWLRSHQKKVKVKKP